MGNPLNRIQFESPELIKNFNKGSNAAFGTIFKIFYVPLVYFSTQILQDKEGAQDIVNDTFIKLWQKQGHFETPGNLKAFLYITVKHASLNVLRHDKVKLSSHKEIAYLSSEEEEPFIVNAIIKSELIKCLYGEIEKLPPKRKLIFLLAYIVGLKNDEIAEELKLNISTVKTQKARSIKFLKLRFSANGFVILLFLRPALNLLLHHI